MGTGVVVVDELPAARCDEAVALWHEVGLTRPWNDPVADLGRALAGPSSTVLAATDTGRDGELVGTVMVGHDGHRGWVYYLAVRPSRQREGVGRELVAACETWLVARGIPKLQLMVREGNDAAVGFYGALGYERSEVVVLGRRLDG
jgi:ribosomal protein S18 acetylase RimI-like enzyme